MTFTLIPRRRSVPAFVARMSERHPELLQQVTLGGMLRMAARDNVAVAFVRLPRQQKARTLMLGGVPHIRINRSQSRYECTTSGLHELCHIWRDGLRSSPYYSDELTGGASCEFADIFAWYVTSERERAL